MGAQLPAGGDRLPEARNEHGVDGVDHPVRMIGEEAVDHSLALFRIERAVGKDQLSARLDQRDGMIEQDALDARELGDILRAFGPDNVRMAPDGAGRRTGRIQKHGVETGVVGDLLGARLAGFGGQAEAQRSQISQNSRTPKCLGFECTRGISV